MDYKGTLDVSQTEVRASCPSLEQHMTLRNACKQYRDNGGVSWDDPEVPELSGALSESQMPCMNKFDNIVGAVKGGEIVCFEPEDTGTLRALALRVAELTQPSVDAGTLWALHGTVRLSRSESGWGSQTVAVTDASSEVLDAVAGSGLIPLSLNTVHAPMEASRYSGSSEFSSLFLFPHNAVPSNGLYGTLADNQAVDMCPGEDENDVDHESRKYKSNYLGFVCTGHTSHSTEAGRVRRVTSDCKVRILSHDTLDWLRALEVDVADAVQGKYTWVVFCMGLHCKATESQVMRMALFRRRRSLSSDVSCSLHIDSSRKLAILSISSGCLFKLCSNGYWADNVEVHASDRLGLSMKPTIDTKGRDALRACQSTFFSTKPYIMSDRAPRPLFSSVQLPQAICLPWCPGTAAISPCYSFSPIVTTELYRGVMLDQDEDTANLGSYLPGENVGVLHLNMEYNYEDAIIVSQKYVDNGGFSSVSVCFYLLEKREFTPEPGATLCAKLSPWWKSACVSHCPHDEAKLRNLKTFSAGTRRTPGVLVSCDVQPSGHKLVKVRSYEQLQWGDKISNGHGQKGIAVIVPYEDMPMVHHPKMGTLVPDAVMAMSSVINRQTNGQLYEACDSVNAIGDGCREPRVVRPGAVADVSTECTVLRGCNGELFTTVYGVADHNETHVARATFGYMRMYSQTQKSRERHHVSHLSPGKNSLRTPTGRSRGGGVACGEMEVQAGTASGLQNCVNEVVDRGDMVVARVCKRCQRLGLLCTCTSETHHVNTCVPYDTLVFDITTFIVYGASIEYVVESQV